MMDLEKARIEFSDLQKKISAFNHATALIYFDGETFAPSETLDNRAHSLEILNDELYQLKTGEKTVELLDYLEENKDWLTVRERRSLEFMQRELRKKKSIPKDEYVEYEHLLAEAQDAWHRAREEDDFDILCPYLEKIFDSVRRFASYCAPDKDPYDYCLDNYEEGLESKTCDKIFDSIKANIIPLVHKITERPQIDNSCLRGDFSAEDQESLAIYIMELLKINMNRVGLATSEHPFVSFMGSHYDERITTKYSRKDYSSSLYTVMHEVGHVLYDMGQPDNLAYTVLDGGTSMVLLESQARFYENIVGRSKTFIEYIYPTLEELFPDPISEYTPEDIYKAVNMVEPGLNRIDSDELTFNIHVLIRYELEKAIMHNELQVKDLPKAWAEKYKEYLGVEVKDYANGILQDIHWPFGAIGYFPAYVLGNAYAANITEKMKEDIDLEECLAEGNFALINLWNKEHIWKHGGLYNSKEIMEKYVGVEFTAEPFINYLENKYKEVYEL